jgi:hypothetical protein
MALIEKRSLQAADKLALNSYFYSSLIFSLIFSAKIAAVLFARLLSDSLSLDVSLAIKEAFSLSLFFINVIS